ncbi:uncharacterized protein LAESUDRAFT_813837 [Laetiporus sulphureus 93-53]|uniref:Uncharacterized protein n=1 Tax=Laetiporus sulphureus 93-53 TaxID=1314785 RepID=A0A165DIN7_9APHY|nr:uncharacterized protein LAESUDRAFT_813837 [Laetiporus sulphureus 93-53]KZT04966.1 hypothetical protein LAESUDRAFT_813837 [Laetiporus sulphureus 93-53]
MTGRRPSTGGRLRSKTSDISDLIRGNHAHAKHSDALSSPPPVPPLPEPDSASKSKSKISFFARRRKSTSASPSSSTKSAETKTTSNAYAPPPPLPKLDVRRLSSNSKGAATRSISTPSSPNPVPPAALPPLDVSSPSFGSISQLLPSHFAIRHDSASSDSSPPHKHASAIPVSNIRHIRPQKSMSSADFGRESTEIPALPPKSKGHKSKTSQSTKTNGARPIITVSAPPLSGQPEEDEATFMTPRTAPTPPAARAPAWSHGSTSGRDFHDSPGYASSDQASSTGSPSPRSLLHFPLPPRGSGDSARTQTPQQDYRSDPWGDEHPSKRSSAGSSSSTRETLTVATAAPSGRVGVGSALLRAARRDEPPSRSAPEPNTRPPVNPGPQQTVTRSPPGSPPPRSRIPATASFHSSGGRTPPPLLTTFRRAPRAGPPAEPLPSPPHSAFVTPSGPAESAPSAGSSQPMSALPTIPTLASQMTVGQVHRAVFHRSRANTLSSRASSTVTLSTVNGESSTPSTPLLDNFGQSNANLSLSGSPASSVIFREHVEHNSVGNASQGEVATMEQLRDALNAQSAKYKRLSSYLLTLTERHAAEKNELMRRIEVLEKEARKREREITGLRWLVMNAGQRNSAMSAASGSGGDAARPRTAIRARSSSKSSQGSQHHGGTPPEPHRGFSMDSTMDSMEEGLFELQNSVSDLIAPLAPSPPSSDALASPMARPSASASPKYGAVFVRKKRSNTLPGGQSPPSVAICVQQKQARRTSSPVLSASTSSGLGFRDVDLPSIPSLASTTMKFVSSNSSSSGSMPSSLPSLTAINTASSGLSAIPETPRSPTDSLHPDRTTDSSTQKKLHDEKRASRILKRISASSTASSVSSSPAPHGGKVASSPSIGQVLDRATERERSMDTIMRKLRSYGSG